MRHRTLTAGIAARCCWRRSRRSPPPYATNGMYMTGYGAETMGRGGANLAISDRGLALNFNPAGLGQLQGNHFTLNLSVLAPSLEYSNSVNGTIQGEDRYFTLPSFAYVRSAHRHPLVVGGRLPRPGRHGRHLPPPEHLLRHPGRDLLRGPLHDPEPDRGLLVQRRHGARRQPSTSVTPTPRSASSPTPRSSTPQNPAMSFPGVDMRRAGGAQHQPAAGLVVAADPQVSLGAVYQTETHSRFYGGDMTVNFTGFPGLDTEGELRGHDGRLHLRGPGGRSASRYGPPTVGCSPST